MKKVYIGIILLWMNMALLYVSIEKDIENVNFKIKSISMELANLEKKSLKVDVKKLIVTGYSNDKKSINVAYWRDGRTATNVKAREGICAADWRYYPVGTLFYIPNYGMCEVQDRGGLIKGENRLDLFFSTRRKALEWGVREVTVLVIRPDLEEVD